MRLWRRWATGIIAALVLIPAALLLYAAMRGHPQDLPWTPLDLADPVGMFTGRKLAGLTQDFARCQSLMERAGVGYTALPARRDSEHCGYDDGVRFAGGGARQIDFLPADLGVSCPVAAALALWEWHVVQPAALRHFGKRVSAIEHYGSYSCRRIVGRGDGGWSQHSTADAVDISAFRLADSTRIVIKRDWQGGDPAREAFLREVRTGACDLFSIVLSPDYNAAHADHFHMDQSERGEFGWRGCR
jgi:hypothetical protein